eukprot:SAG31_NODE_3324_length_4411_cov_1.686456_3_plen_43_part_00
MFDDNFVEELQTERQKWAEQAARLAENLERLESERYVDENCA